MLQFEIIQRACNAVGSLPKNMGVNHGCGNIGMAQKRLNGTDVRSALQKVGGETVVERVRRYALLNARPFGGRLDGFVNHGRVDMMPSGVAAFRIPRQSA